MSKPNPHVYRKRDVTGALGFINSLLSWDLMPKGIKKPTTDRDAARLFFEIDRSNATMADFLSHLGEWKAAELDRLKDAARKPPKRSSVTP